MQPKLSEPTSRFPRPFPRILVLSLCAFACATGCSSSGKPTLKLVCLDDDQAYTQRFSKAYASRSDNGEYDLVLINDVELPASPTGDAQAAAGGGGVPASLRQFMHVRVLWKPRRGIRDNLPSES